MNEPGDLDPGVLRASLQRASDWIVEYLENIEQRRVLPDIVPGEFAAALPSSPPDEPEPMDRILQDFERIVPPASTHWNHPSFHAYFANTASGPGIVAEALTAALNSNAMVWRTAPASTELELVVCDWIRQMMGLPEGFHGHINDTASVATLVALAAARQVACGDDLRTKGLSGQPPLRIYASAEAHSSVEKAAIVLGLGQEGLRKISVDDQFRMHSDELARAIEQDRTAGRRPVAVVATVGTTSTTSVDPVLEIAKICRREKLWLHVDAAYGGSMAIAPEFRWVLDGCDRSDSLVVNPHKWMFVPMDCSVLFVRDPELVRRTFSVVAPYLMTPEDGHARNLMDYGPALGRRNRSLKLWMVIRAFGQAGMAERIRNHIELCRLLQSWIQEAPGWELMAPAPMSTTLFRHVPPGAQDEEAIQKHNADILERVNATGKVFLSQTVVRDRFALRLAIGNLRTQRRHLELAWALLGRAATDSA